MLSVLTDRGVPLVSAMTYAALVDRHIFGSGLQDAEEHRMRTRYGLHSAEKILAAITQVRDLATADGRCPQLTRWLSEPVGPSMDEQFELGLDCLLDGAAALRRPRCAAPMRGPGARLGRGPSWSAATSGSAAPRPGWRRR